MILIIYSLLTVMLLKFVLALSLKIIKIGKEEEKKNSEEVRKQVYDELCTISNDIIDNKYNTTLVLPDLTFFYYLIINMLV